MFRYVLNCIKIDKYSKATVLSFDLEICQFDSYCAILRKRLRGDAWFYKRVCEEILRISNGVEQDADQFNITEFHEPGRVESHV